MDIRELIRTRKSVRTFDGRPLSPEDREDLETFASAIENPYGIPVTFRFLDPREHGLASPVIVGETLYVAAKVQKAPHCEEAYGYSFERLVLHAWSLGIGTTWVGGTMDRALFEKAAQLEPGEIMPAVSPLGYPASDPAEVDRKLRASVHGDERLPFPELFFEGDFATPLVECDEDVREALEAVRWYPSAANKQPCRVVRDGGAFHFYEQHTMPRGAAAPWDVQRIDCGIALCHFMSVAQGELSVCDPGIPTDEDTDYVATVTLR